MSNAPNGELSTSPQDRSRSVSTLGRRSLSPARQDLGGRIKTRFRFLGHANDGRLRQQRPLYEGL
jgi:hypothetical protein